jgi:hypothetical protein
MGKKRLRFGATGAMTLHVRLKVSKGKINIVWQLNTQRSAPRSIDTSSWALSPSLRAMPSPLAARRAFISRNTKETKIQVSISLDGGPLELLPDSEHFPISRPEQTEETHASQDSSTQQIWIWTGIGFLDHMLHALAKHAGWSLRVRSRGDLASKISGH